MMKRISLNSLLSMLMATMVGPSPAETAKESNNATALSPDAVLRSFVKSIDGVPGVAALAATRDRVIHQGAFGSFDPEIKDSAKVDTLFAIASMTKPVTSVAVMQLVEQGQLELDAGVDQYLPEFADPQILTGFDDSGVPLLRAAKRPPTVRELLSNTGGLAYLIWNENLLRFGQEKHRLPKDKAMLRPFVSEPGTRWEYGPGTNVLGEVVERVSGLMLEEYFRKHIFAPLGMDDTFYQVPKNKWDRAVRVYFRRQADGSLMAHVSNKEPMRPPKVTRFHGDRGLTSSGPDYLRFVQAFLNDGELNGVRILTSESIDLMSRNQIGDLRTGELISVMPEVSNDVHFFPGAENKFGLGFLINGEPVPGGRAAGSLMWAGAANTYFWIDRKQGIGGVVMTQLGPFADATVLELVEAYEKAIYAILR